MPTIRANGADLAYTRTGNGPAVLLIQGVGVVGNGWRPQVDHLQGDFTLFAFDNRGIGGSTPGDDELSIELMASDAMAIMAAERVPRFHVAGHSMGGLIAQAIALAEPARVLSLALLCSFARGKDATALTMPMLIAGLRTRIGTRGMRRRAFLELIMPGAALSPGDAERTAAELAPLFGHDLADHPPIVMKQLRAASRYDAYARLTALGAIPTMVVSAARDIIARPSSGRALAAAIPGASFRELQGLGHGAPIQAPALVSDLLRTHFDGSARTSGKAPDS